MKTVIEIISEVVRTQKNGRRGSRETLIPLSAETPVSLGKMSKIAKIFIALRM